MRSSPEKSWAQTRASGTTLARPCVQPGSSVAGRRPRARSDTPRNHEPPRPEPLGQHHLLSARLAHDLVRAAAVGPDDLVVDIGAGTGRLTEWLAQSARHVVAIELDERLAAGLRDRWPNVEVICADAVATPLPRDPFRVVANLPFQRTNDILHRLLDDPALPLQQADLIVEWGVACKRGLPWPSSVHGVVWSATWTFEVARRLPRTCFSPPPSVDAGVMVLKRRAQPLVALPHLGAFHRFVARGFRHGLRAVTPTDSLRRAGFDGAHARDLDVFAWRELFADRGRDDGPADRATSRRPSRSRGRRAR